MAQLRRALLPIPAIIMAVLPAALYMGCGLEESGLFDIPPEAESDSASDAVEETAQADSGLDTQPDVPDVNDSADSNDSDAADTADSATDSSVADSSTDASDASDADPPPPTCNAGDPNTVDNITGSGATQTSLFIHYVISADFFSTVSPTVKSFTGTKLPGQLVLLGKDGAQFTLKNGVSAQAKPFYKVDLTVTLPSDCSGGINLASQTCAATVAKSFRCQFAPYNEKIGCPATKVNFTSQPAASSYTDSTSGFQMLLVDLTCL